MEVDANAAKHMQRVQEEARVFQSSIDRRTLTSTVLMQPSFYMGCFSMGIMMLTQKIPEEFLPAKYLSLRYNGLRVSTILTLPFCAITGLYLGAASMISTAPSPAAGHLFGYVLSVVTGLSMISLHRISWYYPLLGVVYLGFGGFHHYRRLMVCTDNAPLFYMSDFTDMRKDRAERKQRQRSQRSIS